jgi:hypothetical protein
MRFGIWNISGLCRTSSMKTVASESVKINLIWWQYKRLEGIAVVVSQQTILYLSVEMGKLIQVRDRLFRI